MLGNSLSNELKYKEQAYDEKIEKIFNLAEKVLRSYFFNLFILLSQKYYGSFKFHMIGYIHRSKFFIIPLDFQVDSESVSVGKAAVGSLLGGIGYFYGQSKIDLSRTLTVRFYYNLV